MAIKKMGKQTIKFDNPPSIIATASIVGKKEGEGPLSQYFDQIIEDPLNGKDTWEKAESSLLESTVSTAISNANLTNDKIDYICAGDLLNQCSSAHFALRQMNIPFFGLYGACSTMAESLSIGAILIDGGFADNVVAATSSHFCAAEKQFRFPLEYGGQRPPTAQWTVTGSGASVLSGTGSGPYVTHITTGKIVDKGITDTNNMGVAMAPAAVDTIFAHFTDTGLFPEDYDLIITGDLGTIGKSIVIDILNQKGYDIASVYEDCGCIIFSPEQDVHAGGSGCGCSAAVFNGMLYKRLLKGELNKILFVATGALMNPTTTLQGESIPSIAHAVTISNHI